MKSAPFCQLLDDSFELDWLIKQLSGNPYVVCFDSNDQDHEKSCYSYLMFDPIMVLKEKDSLFFIENCHASETLHFSTFELAFQELNAHSERLGVSDLAPFCGGIVAALTYEFHTVLSTIPESLKASKGDGFPRCFFGLYDRVIIVDHTTGKKWFVHHDYRQGSHHLPDYFICDDLASFKVKAHPFEIIKYPDYLEMIKRIHFHIREGDIYQANYSYPIGWECSGHPLSLYLNLRRTSPSPYGCYMDVGFSHIVSSSPELLFSFDGQRIITQPIKGTIAKRNHYVEDNDQKRLLLNSKKDDAELMMIVDLERNDLGRIAKKGTVKVDPLKHLETYSHLHHLVSTITAELDPSCGFLDIMEALYPGGSITGAPKYSAIGLLQQFEPFPRHFYTGSMGYISTSGHMMFNIGIRTFYTKGSHCLYGHTGGGIVADSQAELEWEETMLKFQGMKVALCAKIG